jgi:hypothetical protein
MASHPARDALAQYLQECDPSGNSGASFFPMPTKKQFCWLVSGAQTIDYQEAEAACRPYGGRIVRAKNRDMLVVDKSRRARWVALSGLASALLMVFYASWRKFSAENDNGFAAFAQAVLVSLATYLLTQLLCAAAVYVLPESARRKMQALIRDL